MKKTLSLILALLLCLALCACGGNNSDTPAATEAPIETTEAATEEPTEAATEETIADDVVCCVVTVSINPEFNMYLNANGMVLELECLNEGAANATANANVIGLSGDAAIAALLDEIYQYDSGIFETDMPKITLTLDIDERNDILNDILNSIEEEIFDFAEKNQIPLGFESREVSNNSDDAMVISDTIDENGNRVVVEMDADGVEWKTVSSGETGSVLEVTRTDPDGTITHSDMTTNTTTVTKPDGTTEQSQGVIGKG